MDMIEPALPAAAPPTPSEAGTEAELACVVVRWVDDEPQPGIAEVQFTDASGRTWQVIEKSAVLDYGDTITPWAIYPMPWRIRCFVIEECNATIVKIRLAHQMSAADGICEFEVHRDQLLVLESGGALPSFAYHPDPVGTGSVAAAEGACVCCGRNRGWMYTGPVYAVKEIDDDELCPWCIADGSAAERFNATFNDIGNIEPWQQVSTHVVETISRRTPGFSGWQQERWLFHCSDGTQFIGPMGADELAGYPDAIESIREELDEFRWDAELVAEYLARLSKNGQPTAYVFRCRHCQTHVAYTDFA